MWTLADKYGVLTPVRAAEQIIKLLKPYGAFVFKKSTNRSSVYIHFRELPNGLTHKLRISDHEERERYGYKWQLRLDGHRNIQQKKTQRFYFETVESLVKNFEKYYAKVDELNAELMAAGGDYDETYDS